jgi:pentatricopeptide repeat protein
LSKVLRNLKDYLTKRVVNIVLIISGSLCKSYVKKIKQIDHYESLCTLIKFLYRAGKIDEAKYFFDKVEKDHPKSVNDPGYNYAMGLFYQ